MKKAARLLKRERQRIAYDNQIVELAEKKLLGTYQAAASWDKSVAKNARLFFDTETLPTRGSSVLPVHGVAVTHFIHDEILVTWDSAAYYRQMKAQEIVHVQEQMRVPMAPVRSGSLGAVTLRMPGAMRYFVALSDPAKKILIDDYIVQGLAGLFSAEL